MEKRTITIALAPGETFVVSRDDPKTLTITITAAVTADWKHLPTRGVYYYPQLKIHVESVFPFLYRGESLMGRIQKEKDNFSVLVTDHGNLIFADRGENAKCHRKVGNVKHRLVCREIEKLVKKKLLLGDEWNDEAEEEFLIDVEGLEANTLD
jgi:hypothetical protein